MSYRLTRQAELDIYAIVDYIIADNPTAALAVEQEIERVCALIGDTPHIGQHVPFIEEVDYFFVPAGKYNNYLIFYTLDGSDAVIRRVLYSRRDIEK